MTVTSAANEARYPGLEGAPEILGINPMDRGLELRLAALRRARRCGARTRRKGTPCQCPALRGRSRCRLHGGRSPGAPRGNTNGNFRHGDYSAAAEEERRWLGNLVTSCREVSR
jgi:hypothetical protein